MTKEELEKEIRKYLKKTFHHEYYDDVVMVMGFAEPREKQIEIDARQIRALQKQNGELTDKVRELEAQIEKMKCCYNCKHSRTDYVHCITDKHENWEMIEK